MAISSVLGSSALLPAGLGFRNKIINGDMRIAQRGASAVSNAAGVNTYAGPDRWHVFGGSASKITLAQSTVAPTSEGFVNSLLVTSSAATSPDNYYGVRQYIEGNNINDLAWGTSGAKPVTVSFWVRSSITGTYSLAIHNSTNAKTFIANYSVVTANTWEKKTVYIIPETSASWDSGNTLGLALWFDLGSYSTANGTAGVWNNGLPVRTSGSVNFISTSGATFYVTGVQLEQNLQPTPFEQRPIGVELMLCRRYFFKFVSAAITWLSFQYAGTQYRLTLPHPVEMRIAPHTVSTSTWQGGSTPSLSGSSVLATNWATTAGWFYMNEATSIEISSEL